MTASPGREDRLLSLIESLLVEFDSLSKAVRDQKQREQVLFQRLNLAADEVRPCPTTLHHFLFCYDEKLLISSRSRATSVAMSDICMYYLNTFSHLFFHLSIIRCPRH